ncbi:MAG: NYN domain-containing protein [Defluviitaleaceae bacterium]|nr:NYN domain-containing protein [Defluviitaleaceae bacterium]
MLCNTAIFYDIENLLGVFVGNAKATINLDEIYRRVLEMEGVHGVSIQRAYADWALHPNRHLQDSVLQVGIEPIQIFNTNQNDRLKNAADVSLIIDAVELLAKRPEIENYVIASGDGIFAFLSKKLHEHGKRVIGCGFDRNANQTFLNSCDYYISLEKTDKSLIAVTSSRRKYRVPDVPATAAPAPISNKVPSKFPKTKYSENLSKADIPLWKDTHDLAGGLHTIRKIIEALFTDEDDGLNELEISVFKTFVVHYIPSFRVNRYNFTRFGEFMRFVLTGSPFCLYTIDESVCKIARRGIDIKNGTILEDVKGLIVTAEDGSRYGSIFGVPEDMAFIYTILPEAVPSDTKTKKTPPAPKNGRRKKAEAMAPIVSDPQPTAQPEEPTPIQAVDIPSNDSPVTAASEPVTILVPAEPEPELTADEGSLRRWIKSRFKELADRDVLSPREAIMLETPEYSKSTFGIRTPIFKEIESRSNLLEQRSARGKVRYWKETFTYNGRDFLVYKDWTNLHKERFNAWLKAVGGSI